MTETQQTRGGLSYDRSGGGDPPLVFVHGWCCDRTFFGPQVEHFARSHTVVCPDLRGCGLSPDGDGYEVVQLADDVAALCGELGLSRPVVLGHSLGGMVAIELAARHPGLVRAVAAVDPGPIDQLPETSRTYASLLEAMEGPDGEGVRRAFVEGIFLPGDESERRRRIVETMCAVPLPRATAMLRAALAWNGVGALRLCTVPLLVLLATTGGSNDPARLRALKPEVQIGVTVGAGHFHQLEVPEQVTPMLERFLALAVRAP